MHFPTSLPPTSGSPAAKVVFESRNSPHPETFDGPLPPPSTPGITRTKIPLRPRPRFVRLAGPRFPPPTYPPPPIPPRPTSRRKAPEYVMPKFLLPGPSVDSEAMPTSLKTAKLKMKGGLPPERLIRARNSWKRKRKARLDGARKPDLAESIENLDGPFRTQFENAKEDSERGVSLMSANSMHKLKRIFSMGQGDASQETEKLVLERTQSALPVRSQEPISSNQLQRSRSSGTGDDNIFSRETRRRITLAGPRERLMAARASREEDKEDRREMPDSSNSHSLETERHKMNRHVKSLSLSGLKERHDSHHERRTSEKDAHLFQAEKFPTQHPEHLGFTKSAKRRIHMARAELQAYRTSIDDDVHDAKETSGKRIANAVRTAKSRFEHREAERQAGMRMAPGFGRPSRQSRQFSNPQRPAFSSPSYNNSSSSLSLPPDAPNQLLVEGDGPPSPMGLERLPPLNALPALTPRNRAYQQVFAARPSIFYRPTLSPVYSKSPIPTNSPTQLSSTSLKQPKDTISNHGSISANLPDETIQSPPAPVPYQPSPQSPSPGKTEPGRLDVSKKLLPYPTPDTKIDRSFQSVIEPTNLMKSRPYQPHRDSIVVEDNIPSLKLSSPEAKPSNSKQRSSQNLSGAEASSLEIAMDNTHQETESDFKNPVYPKEIPEYIHPGLDSSKTPTSSALEFWAAADASLAPSESASAQPTNRTGKRPPDIWKNADKTLNLQKYKPTLEEWIANLPGLSLQQGRSAVDETINAQMLNELMTKGINESSSRPGIDCAIALAEKLGELVADEPEPVEEFVPEDEAGLTLEEVKALEKSEPVPENAPPPVIDPSLLHPDYRPSPVLSRLLEPVSRTQVSKTAEIHPLVRTKSNSHLKDPIEKKHKPQEYSRPKKSRPSRDLASEAATCLDALEKYWDDQGIIVGTVLRRMLWIVDTIIVKEREEAQRLMRKKEMGWTDEDEDGDEDNNDDEARASDGL